MFSLGVKYRMREVGLLKSMQLYWVREGNLLINDLQCVMND